MKYEIKELTTGETKTISKDALGESYQIITLIPENVEEEDLLSGHPYPGHEMWED